MIYENLNKFIKRALEEDIGDGDHSSLSCICPKQKNNAKLIIKNCGIIAGIKLAKIIFKKVDPDIRFTKILNDGEKVKLGDIAFKIHGKTHSILKSERLVLNCMQHMSAIATKTQEMNDIIKNQKCELLDTRKTTPLNREIEKWAVRIGGGRNHRMGLYDMIMIKDNHIDAANGVTNAIIKTREYLKQNKKQLKIIIEARNIDEVKEIMNNGGIDRILLDNFDYKTTQEAIKLIDKKYKIESSGGINRDSILEYAKCGVDFISVGALTNSLKSFDLSLKISK